MGDIKIGRPDHMSSDAAMAMIKERCGTGHITDECAVTIASWFQSASLYDRPFAALATSGEVDSHNLRDAIYRTRKDMPAGSDDVQALAVLDTWALRKYQRAYVRQVGAAGDLCARKDCKSVPTFRLILGSWHVQVYVCSAHLRWGIQLDSLTQTRGEAMGWEHGYRQSDGSVLCRAVEVIPEMPTIRRTDYGRDESTRISEMFPQYDSDSDVGRWHPVAN